MSKARRFVRLLHERGRVRAGASVNLRRITGWIAVLLLVSTSAPLWAQGGPGPSPVRYTEAVSREVHRAVTLTGTVDSRDTSLVASEVEGVVEKIAAREGDTVRKGAPLARLRRTNLELQLQVAEGQIKEARARLELAESNLQRNRELYDAGVISKREFDDAFSEFTAWQGRIDALSAQIERYKVDLERSTIRAPYSGVVVREMTDLGQWVSVGTPVAEVVALDQLEVRVDVPERYFAGLRPGTRASVTFESLPDVEIEGEVISVIPRADPQARTFPVKVRIGNADGRIGVGMLARVSLPLGEAYQATLVPKDAIVAQGPGRVVYRINGDDTVETVGVTVGRGMGSWVIVDGPIESGARVVTRGNERLMPGQAVTGTVLEYTLP
jgi:RND family efflux transporter MFP subunit